MPKSRPIKPELTPDPKADALADVYLFLLRKAAERNALVIPEHGKSQGSETASFMRIFEQKSRPLPKVKRKRPRN